MLHERKGKYGQWPDFIFSALPRFHVWKQLRIIYFPGASNGFLAPSPSYGLQKCITGNLLQSWNRNWVSPNFKAHSCLKYHSMWCYHDFYFFFKPDELDMNHDEQPQTKSKWTGVLLLLAIKCASVSHLMLKTLKTVENIRHFKEAFFVCVYILWQLIPTCSEIQLWFGTHLLLFLCCSLFMVSAVSQRWQGGVRGNLLSSD